VVNLETLVKRGLIREKDHYLGVKILGEGDIGVPLTVQLSVSKGAKLKIEKAGGQVEKPGTPEALKSSPKRKKGEKVSLKRTKVNKNEKGS
jgi:ribosomal protein L18E